MYALFVTFIVYYTITYNTRGKANCTGMSATYNKYSIFVRVRAGSHGCLRSRLRFTTIADHHGQYSSETEKNTIVSHSDHMQQTARLVSR